MKRVGEIRQRREHTFWKNRCAVKNTPVYLAGAYAHLLFRMAASRAKLLTHRKKKLATPSSVKLIKPMESLSVEATPEKIKEKIRVSSKKSALVPGEGRSMGMELD